jgi:hypothetical protein
MVKEEERYIRDYKNYDPELTGSILLAIDIAKE